MQFVSSSVSGVLLPSFARLDREPERQKVAYLRVCSIMMLIGTAGCLLQAIMGGPMLHLVYHAKYNEAIPLFQLITLGMIFIVPAGSGNNLMLAQGRFRRVMVWTGCQAFLFLLSVAIGGSFGSTKGIAMGVALFFIVCGPLCVMVPLGFTHETFRQVTGGVYRFPILVGTAAGLVAWGVWTATRELSDLPRSSMSGAAAAIVFGIFADAWRGNEIFDLASRLRPYVAKLFRFRK